MSARPGVRNLITDVPGLTVGNASDATIKTGCTVLLGNEPFTCGVHVMGGAPGTRETDLLAPDKTVEQVDALVLSGGSAFGLDAPPSGVADALRAMGRGFAVGDQNVPIVPAAILFDLINGGDKNWAENPPIKPSENRRLKPPAPISLSAPTAPEQAPPRRVSKAASVLLHRLALRPHRRRSRRGQRPRLGDRHQ